MTRLAGRPRELCYVEVSANGVFERNCIKAHQAFCQNVPHQYQGFYCINGGTKPVFNETIKFFLNASSKTPTHNTSPYIIMRFSPNNMNSWVEIEISLHKDDDVVSTFYSQYLSEFVQLQNRTVRHETVTIARSRDYLLLLLLKTEDQLQAKVNLQCTLQEFRCKKLLRNETKGEEQNMPGGGLICFSVGATESAGGRKVNNNWAH